MCEACGVWGDVGDLVNVVWTVSFEEGIVYAAAQEVKAVLSPKTPHEELTMLQRTQWKDGTWDFGGIFECFLCEETCGYSLVFELDQEQQRCHYTCMKEYVWQYLVHREYNGFEVDGLCRKGLRFQVMNAQSELNTEYGRGMWIKGYLNEE
jgi:hypothetical protein